MTVVFQESEAVFTVPSRAHLSRIPQLLRAQADRVSRSSVRHVEDYYMDTTDRRLMRAGVACRLRRTGRTVELTLKTLNPIRQAVAIRTEWTEKLHNLPLRFPLCLPTSPIAERVCPLLGRKRLHLLFKVEQVRRIWKVRTPKGIVLLVSADQVRWIVPGGRSCTVFRVELERCEGTETAFRAWVRDFARRSGFAPASRSKFEEGLKLRCETVPVFKEKAEWRVRTKDLYGRAGRRVILRLMNLFLWHAPAVQLGLDPERLHALRVAIRRLRSALQWWKGALPEELVREVRADLQWLGQTTGPVRDLDVLLAHIAGRSVGFGRGRNTGWALLEKVLEEERERALGEARTALCSRRFETFSRRLKRWAETRSWLYPAGSDAHHPVGEEARRRLERQIRKVFKRANALRSDSPPRDYHRIRIAIKRLRYGLEFFEPLFGKEVSDFRKQLALFQDLLGEHQDAVTAAALIRKMGARVFSKQPAERRAVEKVLAYQERRAKRARRRFRKAWNDWVTPKRCRRLLRAISEV